MDWIAKELSTLSLGDERLNQRAKKVLGQLSRNPTDSIPVACSGAHETKAAYRFFDNGKVTPEEIQRAHFEETRMRMSFHPIVLVPQDTTMLNFSGQYDRNDAGPTTTEPTKGIYLHCAIAVTPDKVCLGSLSIKQWHRKKLQKLSRKERTEKDYCTPIEEKESYRWLENYKKANDYAALLPSTQIICIADREGDIYELYKEASGILTEKKAHFLIRARADRKTCNEKGKKDGERIKSTLRSEMPLGQMIINLSDTVKKKARQAHMTIYAKSLYIELPAKHRKDIDYKPVQLSAILCVEHNPPPGEKGIEWLLLTDLPIETYEDTCEKIQWYTCRWQIEIFFKVLKSGCTIEKLQLTDKNFSACLSFYIIIAWRVLYVVVMGRTCPDISCECIFSKEEWQTTYVVVHRKIPPKTAV